MLRQSDTDVYIPVSGFGHTPEEWESLRVMSFPLGRIPEVHQRLLAGEIVPFVVDEQSNTLIRVVADAYGITSVLCMGLRRGSELYGVHTAGYRHRRQSFTVQQLQIASGISQLAALALDNTRLVDELDHANRLKSEFVATMSHELRTPLNVISGYTDMMLDGAYGEISAALTQPLQRVRSSAHALLDLVTSTLDLSRLDSGPVGIEPVDIDLAALVGSLVNEARDGLLKPGLQVDAVIAADAATIRSDARKLKVVLKNLLNNAVKFTDSGTVTLGVAPEASGILFTVTDTGIGIAADALPLIFEPFRQVTASPQRDYGGVGLGLHIVRRLLDLIHGTIWIDSRLGSGTTARVWLPEDIT
jgi:signal transduction histidine kinase